MKKCAIILILTAIFTLTLAGYKTILALTHPINYQETIVATCEEFNLDAGLVASLINVESSYRKNAKSNKDALGLMQIKFDTAKYLIDYYKLDLQIDENDLFNADTNIYFGCLYLRYLNNKFSNIWTALAAYNAGETRVRIWLRDEQYSNDQITLNNIPYTETKNYIIKIKNNLKFYKNVF